MVTRNLDVHTFGYFFRQFQEFLFVVVRQRLIPCVLFVDLILELEGSAGHDNSF